MYYTGAYKGRLNTWKLGLGVIGHDGSDHKDPNWFPVVELAKHIVMSFGDQHGGRRQMSPPGVHNLAQFCPRSWSPICTTGTSIHTTKIES